MAKYEKPGQPTKYTPELATKICDLIATHPFGLPTIARMYNLPDRQTIYNWLHNHQEFFDKYMQAKEKQAHLLADEVLEVPNSVPTFEDKEGNERIDNGMLGRSKLQMDALRWSASILAPRFYKENKEKDNNNSQLHADVVKRKHDLDKKNRKEF